MGRFTKRMILIIILIGVFLLTGCNKIKLSMFNASEKENDTVVTIVPENNENDTLSKKDREIKSSTSSASATPTMSANIQLAANTELPIYNVNAETEEVEPVIALINDGSDITPDLIVDTVIESLADQSIIIGKDKVTTDKDAVIISFKKDKTPYTNMGSSYEEAILDAFAYSLFDNLEDYTKVIYRIEGKAYTGGAFEYGIDEPYLEK